ncbi:MAG: ABC transporter ATP-binding protein [Tissierellia bacterium]|nr:ABC transporter ATP-binding protein [Tissierellia bacterium]
MEDRIQEKKIKKEEQKAKSRFRNKRLFQYAMKLKSILIIGLVATLVGSLTELLGPYIISKILDENLIEGVGARDYRVFVLLVLAFLGVSIGMGFLRFFMEILFSKLANGMALIIRKDVFSHVINLPVQFFDKYPAGKIVTRITNDTQDIRLLFQILFFDVFTNTIFTLGLLIGLFMIDPYLFLLTLISSPFVYFIFKDYTKKSTLYNAERRRYNSEMNANLNETIQTMEVVQSFNNEEYVYKQYSDLNDKHFKMGRKLSQLWGYSSFNATRTLGNLVIAFAVVYFALTFLAGRQAISIGGLYIFVEYNRRFYQNLNHLSDRIGELEKAKTAADQVFELLEYETYSLGDKVLDLEGNLEFKGVYFAYDKEDVLKDINLSIPAASSAAFVGHTGSGKSTIMNLIYGFYKIERGSLEFDGHDIRDLDMVEIRKQMAIVFQNPYIFEGTIYDNIALFDPAISKEKAQEALINVGGDRILMRDKGIDAKIQEGGSGVSAGEKQLISFARAMVRNPKLLVLDEATSNVDSQTEEYIQYGVNKLKEGRTTLIIAHRLSTIKDVDKIFVLDKGRIIEEGSHDQLIAAQGVYARMYEES